MGRDISEGCRLVSTMRFQSTLPAWGETYIWQINIKSKENISIHSPRMGRDRHYACFWLFGRISIHSPRMGRDIVSPPDLGGRKGFQSTLPAWGETGRLKGYRRCVRFQSTLPAWGETSVNVPSLKPTAFQSTLPAWGETVQNQSRNQQGHISIHSPRMGRDPSPRQRSRSCCHFNPLSPHGERRSPPTCKGGTNDFNPLSPHGERPRSSAICAISSEFQSTLPAWGETISAGGREAQRRNFNPLSPHGERPEAAVTPAEQQGISIHSPRMGRDQSSVRRLPAIDISIHSPRMGRDMAAEKWEE